jgi:Cu/Ag efflux pump CusA
VRDGPQALAIRADADVVRREGLARLAYPNPPSAERLVLILMTALAAGLALVPIALSAGPPGSENQAPMATVILFGLLTSTALNMLVVPVVYARFGQRSAAVYR